MIALPPWLLAELVAVAGAAAWAITALSDDHPPAGTRPNASAIASITWLATAVAGLGLLWASPFPEPAGAWECSSRSRQRASS